MTAEQFFDALGGVSDEKVAEAGEALEKRGRRGRGLLAAACAAIVLLAAVPLAAEKLGLGGPGQDGVVHPVELIEFGGAYYEVIEPASAHVLDDFGLPREITEDMVGRPLGAGVMSGGERSGDFYIYETYAHVFTEEPLGQRRAQRAVYVYGDGDVYKFALYCNFLSFDSNTHTEASELLSVYGIDEASDIASITAGRRVIDDPEEIERFFDALMASRSMGNDDYQSLVYGGLSETEQQELSRELADSSVELELRTAEGLTARGLYWYPETGCLYWALSYYSLGGGLPE